MIAHSSLFLQADQLRELLKLDTAELLADELAQLRVHLYILLDERLNHLFEDLCPPIQRCMRLGSQQILHGLKQLGFGHFEACAV